MRQLSPDTLQEEGDWEKLERQRRTEVLSTGIHVVCRPNPEDPEVQQVQNRAACLLRPYPACPFCPHSTFTLVFDAKPQDPYEMLACPRWKTEQDRLDGNAPDSYVPVERAVCYKRPFSFCASCPSKEVLEDMGAEKVRPGWYGRWRRIMKEEMGEEGEDSE